MVNTDWVIPLDYLNHIEGRANNCGDLVRIGIVTISDRASKGEYLDEGGPAILEFFKEAILSPVEVYYSCIPE